MNAGARGSKNRQTVGVEGRGFRLAPIARAVAVILAAGAAMGDAHAQRAFSPAWFGAMGTTQNTVAQTGMLPNGKPVSSLTNPTAQQQQANAQLQRSINNLNLTARAIAAQQAAQAANNDVLVPDGIAEGGLKVDTNSLTAGWINAQALDKDTSQTTENGKTTVKIEQTADKAILNWETFNVGKNTTVQFDQQSDWAVLNRVNDPAARPSEIQGQIKAPGTVLIVNRNGIVFSGTSQVDTRNLVAAAANMRDDQFQNLGIYSDQQSGGYLPSFTDALGKVQVQAGAQITTQEPSSVTQGGGYVLLLGADVDNAGQIITRKGQAQLAAGDDFIIRKGVATDSNQFSTTRGNEVAPQLHAGSTSGTVSNTGLLMAREGDVTMAGHNVLQDGVAVASTTVDNRGTIHLLNSAADTQGQVTLGADAVTAVVIEDDGTTTALDSQREATIIASAAMDVKRRSATPDAFDNLSKLDDREDLSRIEIVSGNDVNFEGNSLTLATGGQIAVSAVHRSVVADQAQLDVSGSVGVQVAMSANNIDINVQGNEQRDAPVNRDTTTLNNSNIWIDRRNLIHVAAGVGGDPTDRWYTAGGLLEVGGYLGLTGHSIGEWSAEGGSVTFAGAEVVSQTGSNINLSGGSLDVQTGYMYRTLLLGADGHIYDASTAPGDVVYKGLYVGYMDEHPRWGDTATENFGSPLVAPQKMLENGYTVGRDAGRLIVSTNSAVLEGDITADTYQAPRQVQKADAGLDGYEQSQNAAARGAQLIVGNTTSAANTDPAQGAVGVFYNLAPTAGEVVFTNDYTVISNTLGNGEALPADRQGTIYLDSSKLDSFGLGAIVAAGNDRVTVDGALTVAPGGVIDLYAPQVSVNADLTARSGSIALGNVRQAHNDTGGPVFDISLETPAGGDTGVNVAQDVTLDARGVWSNLLLDPSDGVGVPYVDGGTVIIRSTDSVLLDQGSLVDVSSGAALMSDGSLKGGAGGDVTLAAGALNVPNGPSAPLLQLGNDVRAYGVNGGGTLTLETEAAVVIGAGDAPADDTGLPVLMLDSALFQTGFSNYVVNGHGGMSVADGAAIDVFMPVYRWQGAGTSLAGGADPAQALQLWTPPLYQEDPVNAVLTQRGGASLSLVAGGSVSGVSEPLSVGQGAVITVDPGSAIVLKSNGGQVTIDGRINAWGGSIDISSAPSVLHNDPARSIWIGDTAVLDAASRSYVAYDTQGRAYGAAPDGGSITLGEGSDSFIVIRPGALLDASGSAAVIDMAAGDAPTAASQLTTLAGNGGSIELHSYVGMALDGDMLAHAGAMGSTGAAGGSLTVDMTDRTYTSFSGELIGDDVQVLHSITLVQDKQASGLSQDLQPGQADDKLVVGNAVLSAQQVKEGGFDDLTLSATDLFVFDGDFNLSLGRSLTLQNGVLSLAEGTPGAQVHLAAPYILLNARAGVPFLPGGYTPAWSRLDAATRIGAGSTFTLSADLIDVDSSLVNGGSGTQGSGNLTQNQAATRHPVDVMAFSTLSLESTGDIRFGGGGVTSPGDILVDAAQLYPMSGKTGILTAGMTTDAATGLAGIDPDSVLRIRSNGQAAPVPDSVFGQMTLLGGTVDQGGVVRAPLGNITISASDSVYLSILGDDSTVILRSGSITSVSADGLVMPFGGTVDGLTYRGTDGAGNTDTTFYNLGATIVDRPTGHTDSNLIDTGVLPQGITIGGNTLIGEPNAVLDLSGGGDLRGAGFISGRGGSVDILTTPLVNANPALNRYGSAGDHVYAIVPGRASDYAPVIADKGAGDPAVGRQIEIGNNVPGLPAGTYTLLPASYSLMPGAWRVEVGAQIAKTGPSTAALPGGSWVTSGTLKTANTSIRDALPSQLILSPGATVRDTSQYNETSYADFAKSQAALFGNVRPRLPEDGKILRLNFVQDDDSQPLQFAGIANFAGSGEGIAGQMIVTGNAPLDITAPDTAPTPGEISLRADQLSAFDASSLSIGGYLRYSAGANVGDGGARLYFESVDQSVHVTDGADLKAGEIFLVAPKVLVDGGATLDTRGFGAPGVDSSLGYVYGNGIGGTSPSAQNPAVLALSNGRLDFLAADGIGHISVGDGANLLTEGTLAFVAPGGLDMGKANLGARYLTVSQDQVNIGNADSLAAAQAAGVLPAGWQLTQDVLDRLLHPSTDSGVPALERLNLTAGGAFNFFGSVTLDTGDSQAELVLNTPAFHGWGTSADTVHLVADTLVWNGVSTGSGTTDNPYGSALPTPVGAGGPGTGSEQLVIDAKTVMFGYDALAQPQTQATLTREVLGFSGMTINATDRVSANSLGSLSVSGDLNMNTPLLTGEAGSVMTYDATGAVRVAIPAGATPADTHAISALGGTVTLQGSSVVLDTAVALPSGKLTIAAGGDITLGDHAFIDLAGRDVVFFDVTKYSWGGDVVLQSDAGAIRQGAGSFIDVSATHNDAGSLSVLAPGSAVDLAGGLSGKGGDGHGDGHFTMQALQFGDAAFASLNGKLNDDGFFAARDFTIRQGNLTVGDGVRAHEVSIAVDGGSLTINGTIDASGNGGGEIDLAASGDLTLGGKALLDAHGTTLVTDSDGNAIDASNRPKLSLTSAAGVVTLADGAHLDLRSADSVARGEININAPRLGGMASAAGGDSAGEGANDVAVNASGHILIDGANSIAVNGFRPYKLETGAVVNQDYLGDINDSSSTFIDTAWANGALQDKLAGLTAYGAAYHLRPGVEIRSDGDISTEGDIDLSGYRYGPDVDPAVRGSGEPGVLVLRAAGNLNINGSITDGFGVPNASPDDTMWGVFLPTNVLSAAVTIHMPDVVLAAFVTTLPFNARLNFELDLVDSSFLLNPKPGAIMPSDASTLFVVFDTDTVATAPVFNADGSVLYRSGEVIPAGTNLVSGEILGRGFNVGTATAFLASIDIPAGTPLSTLFASDITLPADLPLPVGATLPAGSNITYVGSNFFPSRTPGPDGTKGKMWADAPMLAPGTQSWSLRLVGGADLTGADSRALQSAHDLAGSGNVVLDDPHVVGSASAQASEALSVLRTGTGDLEILAGGNYSQNSLFGVYTAGTQIATADSADYNVQRSTFADSFIEPVYQSLVNHDNRIWFTEHGGDVTLSAQGNITGYQNSDALFIGDWLGRQGGDEIGQKTAWGINFSTYVTFIGTAQVGFEGVGALGGGNLNVHAGGDIGLAGSPQSGMMLAVAGTGRVAQAADGTKTVLQTGGGNLNVTAGGKISDGLIVDIRGDVSVDAGSVGGISPINYGVSFTDPRFLDTHTAYAATNSDGVSFAPGDGTVTVDTRGDLVLGDLLDPGRGFIRGYTQASDPTHDGASSFASTWFTLWRDDTAVDAFSAGGNLTPLGDNSSTNNIATAVLPPILRAVAAGGSIYLTGRGFGADYLMPSPQGQLELLADGLISGDQFNSVHGGGPIGLLQTSASAMATPLHPAWYVTDDDDDFGSHPGSNYWGDTLHPIDNVVVYSGGSFNNGIWNGTGGTLFMFGPNTQTDDSVAGDGLVSHIYALNGDVSKLVVGGMPAVGTSSVQTPTTYYQGSKPVRILAGGDIVNTNGVIVQDAPTDVSMIAAQGSIVNVDFKIGGPGTLEVSAGKQIYEGNANSLVSLGPIAIGDTRPGADIAVQAGLGAGAPGVGASDFAQFASLYLDPANLADPARPLADQSGKVAKTYEAELIDWLGTRYGFTGTAAQALAYFDGLEPVQQRIFVRQVFYAELTAGGREFNNPDSPRFDSYLRGRDAIAALFPEQDAAGNAIARDGGLTLFQGHTTNAGIRTVAGGSIQTLTPGGATVVGVEGITPATNPDATPAGLLTQGAGDIQMYSEGSILLGLSRIMTTFGGDILGWSATGDINAGRGSKTTIVYTPPKVIYDDYGNVTLSPNVPSNGAGIATLDPLPEIPPGDVDLIAPLGTIDAGEAGIRVSGNVNLAALQVVNAANIQVQGKSTGIPVVAAVNVGALTNASAAAAQATIAAQDVMQRERVAARQALPSVFTVRVLGFGNEPAQSEQAAPMPARPQASGLGARGLPYNPANPVQFVGVGRDFDATQVARLNPEQRRQLQQDR